MMRILFVIVLFFSGELYAQPLIPEDRKFIKLSADVVKMEKDIYMPGFNGSKPSHFIRWEFTYSNGRLITERSFMARRLSVISSERKLEYDQEGKVIKDSTSDPSLPQLDYYTSYEYNDKGQLLKAIETSKVNKKLIRVDTYKKYKDEGNYQKVSQFFGDEGKETVQYTSVFEGGLKRKVIYKGGFAPVSYTYDATGILTAINDRKFFYKRDERGNPVAIVAIERGMRMYDFIRLTYADGLVTGSLEPDKLFMQEWDKKKE